MAIISMFPAGGSGSGNTLHITFADSLIGSKYTITNGDETITGTVPSSGVVDVTVKGSGTYTVECGDFSSTIEVQSEYDISVGILNYIAFYSVDDDSLNFCGVNEFPEIGSTLLNKTVTTVYEDVDSTGTDADSVPWHSDAENFKSIIIDESFKTTKLKQTAYWFDSCSNCTSIEGLEYLNTTSVTTMAYMFNKCSNLTALDMTVLDTTNVTDTTCMCYGCSLLNTFDFQQCVSIGASAFGNCTSLPSAIYPSCTTIGSSAFRYCSHLSSISFPSCTTISSAAFYQCTALTGSVSFPACTTVGYAAFTECKMTRVSFPVCRNIEQYGFQVCTSLSSAYFPSCTFVGASAFHGCSALTTISFPKCTTIHSNAFYSCTKLSQAYFMGSSVISLGTSAFYSTSLANGYGSIYVPSSLVDSYKVATNWSSLADRIVGI